MCQMVVYMYVVTFGWIPLTSETLESLRAGIGVFDDPDKLVHAVESLRKKGVKIFFKSFPSSLLREILSPHLKILAQLS